MNGDSSLLALSNLLKESEAQAEKKYKVIY